MPAPRATHLFGDKARLKNGWREAVGAAAATPEKEQPRAATPAGLRSEAATLSPGRSGRATE